MLPRGGRDGKVRQRGRLRPGDLSCRTRELMSSSRSGFATLCGMRRGSDRAEVAHHVVRTIAWPPPSRPPMNMNARPERPNWRVGRIWVKGGWSARRRDERPLCGLHNDVLRVVSRIPSGESAKRGVDAFDGASHLSKAHFSNEKYPLAREAATMIYYTPLNASS